MVVYVMRTTMLVIYIYAFVRSGDALNLTLPRHGLSSNGVSAPRRDHQTFGEPNTRLTSPRDSRAHVPVALPFPLSEYQPRWAHALERTTTGLRRGLHRLRVLRNTVLDGGKTSCSVMLHANRMLWSPGGYLVTCGGRWPCRVVQCRSCRSAMKRSSFFAVVRNDLDRSMIRVHIDKQMKEETFVVV